jgi:hypothetical protein
MSALLHDISSAALPVAIGLLTAAALARVTLWLEDADTQRLARQYLDPLSIWCLVAVGVHTVALAGAREATASSLAVVLAIAAAAVWLPWTVGEQVAEQREPPVESLPQVRVAEPESPPQPVRPLAPDEALWARPVSADRRPADQPALKRL